MKRLLVLLLLVLPGVSAGDERILGYHSDILVRRDGSIEVTETIRVRAEGRDIRRGIYRDHPTIYRDRFGNAHKVKYELLGVSRNGLPEEFHSENRGNGVRTYFGSAGRLLAHGEHTYTYRYRAGRMLGFFESHDELYWNVTGNEWQFPIDSASATVGFEFSLGGEEPDVYAYTGPRGANGDDYETSIASDGWPHFRSTATLPAYSGLTIVVGWPKGLVTEPGIARKFGLLLSDNSNLLVAIAGLLGLFAYYIPVWEKHGKDPEPGVVFARYEPPHGFSPASLRYIEQMHYDDTVLTAAVLNLAVKGYLKITNSGDDHSLQKKNPGANAPALAAGERELYEALFSEGNHVILEDDNHKLLGKAKLTHQTSLNKDYANHYFVWNGRFSLPGIGITLLASVIALNVGTGARIFVVASIVAMIIVVITFAFLMRRPTGPGRKVLDQMAGFKEYLEIAEKDELHLRNPPKKTPQLFEKYLPFALAVGVEQAWAERFAELLATIRGPDGGAYHPIWYSGSWNNHSLATTTRSFGSDLGSAISSSVTPPGSSSGGGGGGFSGGGGGGGGGGGW